jgi:hypothetical protein
VKIESGPIFWKWKYDKWKYMWSVYEDVIEDEYEVNLSLQTKSNQNPKMKKEKKITSSKNIVEII